MLPFIDTPFSVAGACKVCKRPDGKYFRLCRPNGLGYNYQFCHWSRKAATDRTTWIAIAVFQRKLFTKTGNDLDLVTGHSLPALCFTASGKPAPPPPSNEAQGMGKVSLSPAVNWKGGGDRVASVQSALYIWSRWHKEEKKSGEPLPVTTRSGIRVLPAFPPLPYSWLLTFLDDYSGK